MANYMLIIATWVYGAGHKYDTCIRDSFDNTIQHLQDDHST